MTLPISWFTLSVQRQNSVYTQKHQLGQRNKYTLLWPISTERYLRKKIKKDTKHKYQIKKHVTFEHEHLNSVKIKLIYFI